MRGLIVGIAAAVALAAAPPDPVSWKLVDGPGRPVKAGSRFSVRLVATVQQGWHMYSLKPIPDGPIPTRIWIAEGQPILLASPVKAQDPLLVQDPSLDKEVEVYEGEASFTLPLRVPLSTDASTQMLVVNASYQACDNKMCLPPKTVKITTPVEIVR